MQITKRAFYLLVALVLLQAGLTVAQGSLFGTWQRLSDNWSLVEYVAGNSGTTIKTGTGVGGSYEQRIGVLGNAQARPWWRHLYQIYGGVEIQNSSNESFSDAHSVIALGPQTNTTLVVEHFGISIDATNLNGGVYWRNYDGVSTLGGIRVVPNGIGGFQMIFSVRNTAGQLIDVAALDPSIDPSGALAIMADGGQHRLRREANGNATLQ